MRPDVTEQIRDYFDFLEEEHVPLRAVVDDRDGFRFDPATDVVAAPAGVSVSPSRVWWAAAAMAVVLIGFIVAQWLAPIPPADTPVPTTMPVSPSTTAVEGDVGVPEVLITESDGPLSLTVRWERWSEDWRRDLVSLGYDFSFSPVPPLARLDGRYVLPVQSSLLSRAGEIAVAESSDGSEWSIGRDMPLAQSVENGADDRPIFSAHDGRAQIAGHFYEWPNDDGSVPENALFAYHDGTDWVEGSFAIRPVVGSMEGSGSFEQHWVCVSPDGAGGLLDATWSRDGIVDGQGMTVVVGDQATPVEAVGGVYACLDGGIYTATKTVWILNADAEWEAIAEPPTAISQTVSSGWSDSGTFMAHADGQIWVTQDFIDWRTFGLPGPVDSILSEGGTIVSRDGRFYAVTGRPSWPIVHPTGLWVSEDLEEWELLPNPPLEGFSFTAPVGDIYVGGRNSVDVWVGKIDP